MKTLHYAGFQPHASGFGWATCNTNLRKALGEHFELQEDVLCAATYLGAGGLMDFGNHRVQDQTDVAFIPIADHALNPVSPARGKINLGYCFFESPLPPIATTNARQYDLIFTGSTWCKERLAEAGIHNVEVLIQGVDREIFKPGWHEAGDTEKQVGERRDSIKQFRIFSGGKFEWRKGQDLVIRAFAEFVKLHPEANAHLVCNWYNPWPTLIREAAIRGNLIHAPSFRGDLYDQGKFLADIMQANGIPKDKFTMLPQLAQQEVAREMRNTDVGLFPNRCEGGTNLVLMEYAACGRPPVANMLTGHRDMFNAKAIPYAINAKEDAMHWADQSIGDIVAALECAYIYHTKGWAWFNVPTWQQAAQQIANAVERLMATK